MAEQLLKRADIVPILKQKSSKGMPECMTGGGFGDARLAKGLFQRFCKYALHPLHELIERCSRSALTISVYPL
jgi:hypothetical protein